jgi:cysteinyl-tRNA synthetase
VLKVFNSETKTKQTFQPIEPGKVGIYVCGMTVYDLCHLGHARVLVAFDVIVRYFRQQGFDVNYVRNITDVDDKIIQRAIENNESIQALTKRFIAEMHQDADSLGVLPPDQEPCATLSMPDIISMIERLIENGFAYVGDSGDVYFEVNKFESYGRLSGKNLDELIAGERVDIAEAKRNPLDFVLWKQAKADEPSWSSVWGEGRPGWHIECSAMSTRCLGNHFDIHGGGMDLQFPHHENEIAQSEGATGQHFVNYWMHNGFVRIDDEKMSKSLGNFLTVREVLKQYRGEEIRFFVLSSQYRSPLNYSDQQLDNARAGLTRFYTALRGTEPDTDFQSSSYAALFHQAMQDDFNTPEALAAMYDLSRELNRLKTLEPVMANKLAAELISLGDILGLLQMSPEDYFKSSGDTSESALSDDAIESMIEARAQARVKKDWALSDKIRDDLKTQGVILEDQAGTTTWRRG